MSWEPSPSTVKVFHFPFCLVGLRLFEAELHDSIEASLPLIAEILKHNEPAVRQQGIRVVIMLAEEGTDFFFCAPRHSHSLLDVFRHSLTDMVQRVIELLNDHDQNVRMLAAAAVGDLARHSKVFPASSCCTGLTSFEAVFRPSIEPVVPRIAELLKDSE
jgi:HEAT repeat protein